MIARLANAPGDGVESPAVDERQPLERWAASRRRARLDGDQAPLEFPGPQSECLVLHRRLDHRSRFRKSNLWADAPEISLLTNFTVTLDGVTVYELNRDYAQGVGITAVITTGANGEVIDIQPG